MASSLVFLLHAVGFFGSLLTFGWILKGLIESAIATNWSTLKNWQKILLCSALLLALMCALEVIYGFSQKLLFERSSS